MSWRKVYNERMVTLEYAARLIQSGNRVVFGHGCAYPDVFEEALLSRVDSDPNSLRDVEFVHMLTPSPLKYAQKKYSNNFRYNGFFVSPGNREAVSDGRGDYSPAFFYRVPDILRSANFPSDFAVVTVSTPNSDGYVSFGISVCYTSTAARAAKKTIAIVNPNMPFVTGEGALMHVSDFDFFVPDDQPLMTYASRTPGDVDRTIASHVASLINDGDCLQIGIGGVPEATLSLLGDRKDLGIHSELISDGVVPLIEKGIVTGARKTIDRNKTVIGFAMGSKGFYKWLHHNPAVEFRPIDYVNDPRVVGQIENIVSINACLSIDLQGQVASDSLDGHTFTGVGGQVDFVRGAGFAKGGRSIITLPATAAGGKVSRICGHLPPAQPVTTSRYDVDIVITEYGVAELKGKTGAKRAKSLIDISQENFREILAKQAWDLYSYNI